jgi:hypothetical protein
MYPTLRLIGNPNVSPNGMLSNRSDDIKKFLYIGLCIVINILRQQIKSEMHVVLVSSAIAIDQMRL